MVLKIRITFYSILFYSILLSLTLTVQGVPEIEPNFGFHRPKPSRKVTSPSPHSPCNVAFCSFWHLLSPRAG